MKPHFLPAWQYWPSRPEALLFSRQVEIHFNTPMKPISAENYLVLTTFGEPEEIRHSNSSILSQFRNYDLILTSNPILLRCPNAVLMPFGMTFLDKDNLQIPQKAALASFICGGKNQTSGHHFRLEVWRDLESNKVQFWGSSTIRPPPKAGAFELNSHIHRKIDALGTMYHIAIENSREPGYFTEKVVDAFLTRTVPIYWGCPNIDNFFDGRGIIPFESLGQLKGICEHRISDSDYSRRLPAIEANYRKALEYIDISARLQNIIQSSITKNHRRI